MTSIKEKIDKELEDFREMVRNFMNYIIEERVYREFVRSETEANPNSGIYLSSIQYPQIQPNQQIYTLSGYLTHSNYVTYKSLLTKQNTLNNQADANIRNIFDSLPKRNNNAKVPPFYILKIKKSYITYNGEDNRPYIEEGYNNIRKTFVSEERHRVKIVKFQNEEFIFIIIFFDSLNYSDDGDFIFDNETVEEVDIDIAIVRPVEQTTATRFFENFTGINIKYKTDFNKLLTTSSKTDEHLKDIDEKISIMMGEYQENITSQLTKIIENGNYIYDTRDNSLSIIEKQNKMNEKMNENFNNKTNENYLLILLIVVALLLRNLFH